MSTEKRTYRGGRVEQPEPADDHVDPGRCMAHGCNQRGSVDLGSAGRFMCSAHAWMPAEKWQAITHQLHQHEWLIEHIRSLRADGMQTRWRALAESFWRNSEPEVMKPAAFECRELYLYRLHLELMFRVGARLTRPDPMKPQGYGATKRAGSMAELLHFADAEAA